MINLTRKDSKLYRTKFRKLSQGNLMEILGDLFAAEGNLSLHMRLDARKQVQVIDGILRDRQRNLA